MFVEPIAISARTPEGCFVPALETFRVADIADTLHSSGVRPWVAHVLQTLHTYGVPR